MCLGLQACLPCGVLHQHETKFLGIRCSFVARLSRTSSLGRTNLTSPPPSPYELSGGSRMGQAHPGANKVAVHEEEEIE